MKKLALAACALWALGGCAAPEAPASDAAAPADAGFVVATHPPEDQIPNEGGPVLAHPRVVVITFADDPARAQIDDFMTWLVSSEWASTVGVEYGVHAGTSVTVHLADPAPAVTHDADIQALLVGDIASGTLPRAADGSLDQMLYMVFFPETTVIDDGLGDTSCVDYEGYHDEAETGTGERFAYAAVPTCPPEIGPTVPSDQQGAASHEYIEAATDPYVQSAPAWGMPSDAPSAWAQDGGEVADLCSSRTDAFVDVAGHAVTRVWSNAAAAAGDRDPCLPGRPDYAAVAPMPLTIPTVSPGGSASWDLTVWSTAAVGALRLTSSADTPVTAMLDRADVVAGDRATLTARVPVGTASGLYQIDVTVSRGVGDSSSYPLAVDVP